MNGKADENRIRDAFEQVELPEGAKERMYANILQKAEMPVTPQTARTAPSKKSARLSWRKYASLAACLVIFIAAGAFLPGILDDDSAEGGDMVAAPPASEAPLLGEAPEATRTPEAAQTPEANQNPQTSDSAKTGEPPATSQEPQTGENSSDNADITLSPSPFEEVISADDFSETLGFSIEAPEGAEDVSYSVAFGETAIVDFTLDGNAYTYYASKDVGDISVGDGSEAPLSQTWEAGGINYLLLNTDGAGKTDFEKVVVALQNP